MSGRSDPSSDGDPADQPTLSTEARARARAHARHRASRATSHETPPSRPLRIEIRARTRARPPSPLPAAIAQQAVTPKAEASRPAPTPQLVGAGGPPTGRPPTRIESAPPYQPPVRPWPAAAPPQALPRLPVAPYNRLAGTKPATARLLAAALGAGVLVDLAIRSGLAGLGGAIAVLAMVAGMLLSGRLLTAQSKLLTGSAALFGGWLAIRSSEWLLPLDLVAAFGLLVLGASLSSGGSVADLPVYRLLGRAWHAALHSFAAPAWAIRVGARIGPKLGPTALRLTVGLVVAVPVLIALGALLASADAVFASMLPDLSEFDGADAVTHVLLVVLGGWLLLGLLRTASAAPAQPLPGTKLRLGRIEMTTVLGLVIALLGVFAIAQVVAAIGGDAYVQRTTGMTYAEYARPASSSSSRWPRSSSSCSSRCGRRPAARRPPTGSASGCCRPRCAR